LTNFVGQVREKEAKKPTVQRKNTENLQLLSKSLLCVWGGRTLKKPIGSFAGTYIKRGDESEIQAYRKTKRSKK